VLEHRHCPNICRRLPVPAPARGPFGSLPDGTAVSRWTLTDDTTGADASILDYGAIIQSLRVPDPRGRVAGVVLGFDNLADYLERSPFFGALIGRYGNRIAGGSFELDGTRYQLALNDGDRPNSLHGGTPGFGARMWDGVAEQVEGGSAITLTRVSPDGEEGFPGELTVSVRYTLAHGRFTLDYRAETSAPTVVNLTNHAHFNLAGEDSGRDVLDHELTIAAQDFLPVDAALIPLDGPIAVAGTPFDFRSPRALGARLHDPHPQFVLTDGYDHCYLLTGGRTAEPRPVASLRDPRSGRSLHVATTEPGMQVYNCSHLDGSLVGTSGVAYPKYGGIALETQHYPDSPNRPEFPSTVLRPGEVYRSTTVLDFRTRTRTS
jgi:aldose 1-epimerase